MRFTLPGFVVLFTLRNFPLYNTLNRRRLQPTINSCISPLCCSSYLFTLSRSMASWLEESVVTVSVNHLLGANEVVRREFVENYKQDLFPALGTSTGQTMWRTYRNITRVTIWGQDHFHNNIRLFMVMEALDLGSDLLLCSEVHLSPIF